MKFSPPLASGILIKRYKRFLADVRLADGRGLTLHCPNTGSMKNCAEPGSRIWYSTSENKKRKYPHTFEMIEVAGGAIAGINTNRANALVKEAMLASVISELNAYGNIKSEVRYGEEKSRIDFLLQDHPGRPGEDCYVEVKNVTLGMGKGIGLFPDTVTTRGRKHLRELMTMKSRGHRALLFFCVQHSGIEEVRPADEIDVEYGIILRDAVAAGVEVIAYRAELSAEEIRLVKPVPVNLHSSQ